MTLSRFLIIGALVVPVGALRAQTPRPGPDAALKDQLGYLLLQANGSFMEIRGDSIGARMWRGKYLIPGSLDSATAVAASSISEEARQHADGRPGKVVIGMFPLALVAPGDTAALKSYREQIGAALNGWQNRSPSGGDWTECADPKRGREVILSSGKTASGEMLVTLSITVQPDNAC